MTDHLVLSRSGLGISDGGRGIDGDRGDAGRGGALKMGKSSTGNARVESQLIHQMTARGNVIA